MILEIDAVTVKLGLDDDNYGEFSSVKITERTNYVTRRNDDLRANGAPFAKCICIMRDSAQFTHTPHRSHVSILYRKEGKYKRKGRGNFRVLVFRCASQEITLLSSNPAPDRPLDSNDTRRENNPATVSVPLAAHK